MKKISYIKNAKKKNQSFKTIIEQETIEIILINY